MEMPTGTYAIVRGVATTFDKCLRSSHSHGRIDVDLARRQHGAYCEVLTELGLTLIEIDPDDGFPDCCFVEDTAIVTHDKAIITCMGAESRIGEEAEVRKHLRAHKEVHEIKRPGSIDGGDVLVINDSIYIGVGQRTNDAAIEQIGSILCASGYEIVPVKISGILHLKSACTYIGNNHVVVLPGHFDQKIFSGYRAIVVPEHEAYAANCLSVNGKVLISRGYPRTKQLLEDRCFETIDLEMSEFRKGHGALTCLSKIF
jgi:dimethylargininase